MIEYHKYRGHEICLQLLEVSPGAFRWAWKIDGVHASKSRQVLASEEVARMAMALADDDPTGARSPRHARGPRAVAAEAPAALARLGSR